MLIDMCVLVWLLACTTGMHPDMWEEWWCPACVLDMQPDMWSTRCRRACVRSHAKRHTGCHQPEADWLVSPINTPRPSSFLHIQTCHSVPLMIKWRCCPELVQFYGFRSVEVLLDTPPGSPKNCPEAKGGSVRVQISLSRLVSFFMVKPRFCPSRDQFSPVQSSRPLGKIEYSYRVECSHCCMVVLGEIFGHIGRSPGCDVDTTGPMPYRLDYEDNCVECVLCRQQVRNPPMLGMFWGGLVFPRPRIQRVLTLSPKSGLGWWILKLCGSRYLEVGLWQEAKSNLVTVALGCKALFLDAAGRVSGRTGRGRGVNFVTLAGSSLTRHVALPDHGVGLDGQSCCCLIVGWPVGLSSPTLGVGRPSVMFLFDCWPVG
ncbi:hypothetical protein YC2023_118144 [Brassica napus]